MMLARSPVLRQAHPSSEILASPNPSSRKQRSNRKQRGFPKENVDPNALPCSSDSEVKVVLQDDDGDLCASNRNNFSTTEHLAASLHHGLEIIDSHLQNSPLRWSPVRFSYSPPASPGTKIFLPVEKVDVGVQTLPEDTGLSDEDKALYLCFKSTTFPRESQGMDEKSSLQLVPVDGSMSNEKCRIQVPKAVEKVLAGAIRREMALEEFCSHQTSEIMQLKRLVQQYKHEKECNGIIGQMREDKIVRLENLMDGILPADEFMEELLSLKKEHELLKEKYDNHPDVLSTRLDLQSTQNELEKYRNFFDLGEKDVLLEEIQDLRIHLQFYADTPKKSEIESKWISLAEELRAELESEKKCSEELKEALQLAMEGHARMLEHYAELEERHMQMLARHQNIQQLKDTAC